MDDSTRSTLRDRLFGYTDHIRMLWSSSPLWSTVCLICSLISAASGVLSMIAIGQLVAALAAVVADTASTQPLWRWFVIFASAAIIGQLANAATGWGSARVQAAYRSRLLVLLAEAGLHPPDLATLEDPETAEQLATLTTNSRNWMVRAGLLGTWDYLSYKLTAIGSAVIVLSWRWWAVLAVIAVFLLVGRTTRGWLDYILERLFEKPSDERRRAEYTGRLMLMPESAKEVRLFGIHHWLLDQYTLLWRAYQTPVWRESRRRMWPMIAAMLAQSAVLGGVLALLAYDASTGRIAVAGVTTMVIAVLGLQAFGPMGDIETGLIRIAVLLRNLFGLRRRMGLPDLHTVTRPPAARPGTGAVPIDIDDLHFTYPSRDEPTLSGVSLHIPAGQSVAVVGVNGAGKSTLIKLLAGLYRPDSGTVRVDGRDPYVDHRTAHEVAVVFQEFVHYPLPLRDNVGFGGMGDVDHAVLDKALADAAGAAVLKRLDEDWDAVLSKEFAGGTDLSGGQWQRVALARALAAVGTGAGVLVLDEPTAALDVRAEAEIFDRFLDLTSQVTTILVSHRLSTVRRADRIVVLDGASGRISEDGTHQELLAAGGAYAQMFTLQAQRFARAGASDPGEEIG